MKEKMMKTSELTGAALDWAVATANGDCPQWYSEWEGFYAANGDDMDYSTNWAQGGPIIERERLQVTTERNGTWICSIPFAVEIGGYRKYIFTHGPTPLIAAMRCYVASKLGDEIEIPEELK
jgi:hypothetical protein